MKTNRSPRHPSPSRKPARLRPIDHALLACVAGGDDGTTSVVRKFPGRTTYGGGI